MVASIILGMGVPILPAYALVALVAAPVLVKMGVFVLSAHMFCFIFAIFSCLTPPIAVASIPASSIAGSNYLRTALESTKVGFVGFLVPYLVIFAPELMLEQSSPTQISLTVLSSILAIIAFGRFLVGFGSRDLKGYERLLYAAIAALLFGYVVLKLLPLFFTGILLIILLLFWEKRTTVKYPIIAKGEV
jgi:TRAP-type uncharacterized transport system fused permease subunit